MAWRNQKETGPAVDQIENVVGRSCVARGDLFADGAFRVDGTIEGSVESKAAVVVAEGGTVSVRTGRLGSVAMMMRMGSRRLRASSLRMRVSSGAAVMLGAVGMT